jgi:hypothetical protein
VKIQPVVEGHGEVAAVPVLVRRLIEAGGISTAGLEVGRPIRRNRSHLVQEGSLREAVRLARLQPGCRGILILLDADDDCPAELGPRLQGWAEQEAREIPCAVVLAHREYEAWFLASLDSLRGQRGIRADAAAEAAPEAIRGAKERLARYLEGGAPYFETSDQPALTARFSLAEAHRRSRSFRRLVRGFEILVAGLGFPLPADWPPSSWSPQGTA